MSKAKAEREHAAEILSEVEGSRGAAYIGVMGQLLPIASYVAWESILKQSTALLGTRIMKRASLNILRMAFALTIAMPAWSQGCETQDEMPAQARTSMQAAAQKAFDLASRGDVAGLRAGAIPTLQANFNGIAGAVNDNKAAFSGAHPQVRATFRLDTGPTASVDGRFYCGVFGAGGQTSNSAEFDIPGLPRGEYAIVIQDFIGSKGPYSLTTIFQDMGGWRLAGFYIRVESAAGHDGIWYLERARGYKAKGQNHNAWFYYVTSWDLLAPVTFMETALLSKITQESGSIQPRDIPVGSPVTYVANGKNYSLTDMSVSRMETGLDLSIKYSVASTADFNSTQTDARNLASAFATQYPELKEIFNNVWTHAVDGNGGEVVGLVSLKPPGK